VGQSITFTYDGVSYLRFIYVDQEANTTVTYKIMFNEGSTALPHEPYFEGLRDVKVSEIRCEDSRLLIPAEIQALDGYGEGVNADCYNYIDFEKKQFVKKAGKVNLSSLSWGSLTSDGSSYWWKTTIHDIKYTSSNTEIGNALAQNYSIRQGNGMSASLIGELAIDTDGVSVNTGSATDKPQGMLYYELATPEVTDISHILSDDNMIEVEGGGTVTFENEHQFAVPSSITYMLKGAK
jgi:hypothetical protein